MQIDVRTNFPAVAAALRQSRDQVPFATAKALTYTARDVKEVERREMQTVFDRPVPYTLNSLFMTPATKQTLQARVWVKDELAFGSGTPATKFLVPEIVGGQRRMKGFERALQRMGLLQAGWMAVPGEGADIDGNGNMRMGQLRQIVSYLQTFAEVGYSMNTTSAKRKRMTEGTKSKRGIAYFVASNTRQETRHLRPGVYKRTRFGSWGTALTPMLIFVRNIHYAKRWDFQGVADRTVDARFPVHFDAAYGQALATAFGRVKPGGGNA